MKLRVETNIIFFFYTYLKVLPKSFQEQFFIIALNKKVVHF